MELQRRDADVNGLNLSYFETASCMNQSKTILLVHGIACHGRMWDLILNKLTPTFRVICVELRGHGRSDKRRPYSWDSLGRDLYSFIKVLDLHSIIGVGHSLGGHLLLQAAAILTARFKSLLLLEPAVFEPRAYSAPKVFASPEEHPFARHRAMWPSAAEWFQFLKDRSTFKLWDTDVLWDHCRYGLERNSEGDLLLCCPPLVEAELMLNSTETDIYPLLDSIAVPAIVVRAEVARGIRHPLDNIHSTTWPELAANLPQGIDKYVPELSHFIPMQQPDLVVHELRELLRS